MKKIKIFINNNLEVAPDTNQGFFMKKFFLILVALIGFGLYGFGQNTVIIQQNDGKSYTPEDNINGISFSQDIGGVSAYTLAMHVCCPSSNHKLILRNDNKYKVTVIWEVIINCNDGKIIKKSGTDVLHPYDKYKLHETWHPLQIDDGCSTIIRTITRKLQD